MSLPETRANSGGGNSLAGRVAVVIPAHDHGHFILESIRSALAHGECVAEVLVVDDGSTDGTAETVRGMGDARVRVIRHVESRGPSAARNTGWRATRAEWVFFLDADDMLAPGALGALLAAAEFGSSEQFPPIPYGYQEVYALDFEEPPRFTASLSTRDGSLLEDIAVNYRASIFVALIPMRCLEEMGGFDEGVRYGEDFDFALRLSGARKFRYVPVPDVSSPDACDQPASHLHPRSAGAVCGHGAAGVWPMGRPEALVDRKASLGTSVLDPGSGIFLSRRKATGS